jgi:ABC-type multidrug transport system ATPase subunit
VTNCFGAAVFYSSPTEGGIWNYTLRGDAALGLTTINVNVHSNDAEIYMLPLQHAIDAAIASVNSSGTSLPMPNNVQEYPFTSKTEQQWKDKVKNSIIKDNTNFAAVVWYLGFIGIIYQLVGLMAKERETEMSDLIESMMPNTRRWEPQLARLVGHLIAFAIVYGPSWIIMAVIAKIGLFTHTSIGVLIVGFLLAGLALASFSILGAAFFKRAQLSGITVLILAVVLGIITQIESHRMSTAAVAVLSFFFTPMTFVNFIIVITRWELQSQPTNLAHSPPVSPWSLPGIALWIFFILQIIWYPLLAAFVERALYGTAASRAKRRVEHCPETSETPVVLSRFTKIYQAPLLVRVFLNLLRIKTDRVVAVQDLSLSANKGEIVVLVGVNGCGKSTTMNAIAGLGDMTSGLIRVDGTGGIGLCPQKNVLWNALTVTQHAQIFYRLKRPSNTGENEDINALIATCDLREKANIESRNLSGGQKRKLQLICMLTGGSRVCCVDEVSGGLDPLSRRKVWDILLAERGVRTIILTTHFLDEAEYLADHMVVMHKGELKAEGSTSELKAKLGGGYRLHSLPTITDRMNEKDACEEVKIFPDVATATKELQALENSGNKQFQITGPTIGEVFMRLVAGEDASTSLYHGQDESSEKSGKLASVPTKDVATISVDGVPVELVPPKRRKVGSLRQALMLFMKRWTITRRNPMPIFFGFIIPIIGAGFLSLLLRGIQNPGCALIEQVHISQNQNLTKNLNPLLVAGPSSALNINSLDLVNRSLSSTTESLGSANISILQAVQLVNSYQAFNNFTTQKQANVTPGGLWLGDSSSPPTIDYLADIAISGNTGITGVYNAIFLQNLLDILLTNTSISIDYAVFDFPWPPNTDNTIQFVFYFGLVMAAYPAFFGLYPTRERLKNVRALQYSNGVRPFPLWFAYLAFDFIPVAITSTLVIIIFATRDLAAWYYLSYIFVILLLYGIASILLSYVISLYSKSQLAAFAFSAGGQALMVVLYLTAYMTIQVRADPEKAQTEILVVHFTLGLITPVGQATRAFLLGLNLFSILCEGSPPTKASYPGAILIYGGPIVYLIGQSLLLFGYLVWQDHRFSLNRLHLPQRSLSQHDSENIVNREPEVQEEISRVSTSSDNLRVLHISKIFSSFAYGKIVAVNDLTFGIKQSEVFALVGPNGAGKSTTISMLRGDIRPSPTRHVDNSGLFIQSISVLRERQLARTELGVCPQFDAMDQLNVREHLLFYAGVRGILEPYKRVDSLIKSVGLTEFVHRMAEKLSGGNKRKLSLAIALIGDPRVVLLDEPSSGMDPLAKRNMWHTLEKFKRGRSILLTTHSMEEADALASRVGVISKTLLDIGTTQHLRQKYGQGFHIHVVMKGAPRVGEDEMKGMVEWIKGRLDGAELEGKAYNGQMRFSVPAVYIGEQSEVPENDGILPSSSEPTRRKIEDLFLMLEQHKEELDIAFYSVSPSTFDEVFLKVVEKHQVGEEEMPSRKKRWWMIG